MIILVGSLVTGAFAVLTAVLVAAINAKSNRTAPSPPAPTSNSGEHVLYERTAVLARRADDGDERFHMLDLARAKDREDLDDVLDFLDRSHPDWRD